MEPLSIFGSLLGAGGSIAGGIMGAGEQEENSKRNYNLNLLNYYARERERFERIQEARRQEEKQNEGATDSRGNRVHYVQGKGWVSELSDETKATQRLQDDEQNRVLTQDLPAKRKQMFQNIADAAKARYQAEGVESALKRDDESIRDATARTKLAATSGVNESYDGLTNALNRTNTRTGGNQYANIAAQMGKARAESIGKTSGQMEIAGEDAALKQRSAKNGGLYNILGALQARGAGMPQVQYAPQNLTAGSDARLGANQGLSAAAGNQEIAAFGQKGGTMDYSEPNYGWANAVSGGAQALGSSFGNIGASMKSRQAYGNTEDSRLGGLW